ncbi:hypothetical protein WG915_04855 [Corynebacterium sp. H128]|uniref:hypothetical protein n=1 Tax=Corynebacterium sp. H128 TaxID=3133427 RepID=UPI0030AA4500
MKTATDERHARAENTAPHSSAEVFEQQIRSSMSRVFELLPELLPPSDQLYKADVQEAADPKSITNAVVRRIASQQTSTGIDTERELAAIPHFAYACVEDHKVFLVCDLDIFLVDTALSDVWGVVAANNLVPVSVRARASQDYLSCAELCIWFDRP